MSRGRVELREVRPDDLDAFVRHTADPAAASMAAFTAADAGDREASLARWRRILADPSIVARTVTHDGAVAGSGRGSDGLTGPSPLAFVGGTGVGANRRLRGRSEGVRRYTPGPSQSRRDTPT